MKNAQAAIQKVTSYHFNLTVDNPGTGGVLVIKSADGDILVPDKLQANASVLVIGNVVQVNITTLESIKCDNEAIKGNWQHTSGLLDPRTLSNSNTGVASILGHIQNPSTATDSSVDGARWCSVLGPLEGN